MLRRIDPNMWAIPALLPEHQTGAKGTQRRKLFRIISGRAKKAPSIFLKIKRAREGRKGKTQLMSAAENGEESTVGSLLENGEDSNKVNKKGKTALMFAAENGHTGAVRILMGHRAKAYFKDKPGKTAADYARENGHENTARIIEGELAALNRGLAEARKKKQRGEESYYLCRGAGPDSS